jgi:hypothetical protein
MTLTSADPNRVLSAYDSTRFKTPLLSVIKILLLIAFSMGTIAGLIIWVIRDYSGDSCFSHHARNSHPNVIARVSIVYLFYISILYGLLNSKEVHS